MNARLSEFRRSKGYARRAGVGVSEALLQGLFFFLVRYQI
jgi:hypothetical protein